MNIISGTNLARILKCPGAINYESIKNPSVASEGLKAKELLYKTVRNESVDVTLEEEAREMVDACIDELRLDMQVNSSAYATQSVQHKIDDFTRVNCPFDLAYINSSGKLVILDFSLSHEPIEFEDPNFDAVLSGLYGEYTGANAEYWIFQPNSWHEDGPSRRKVVNVQSAINRHAARIEKIKNTAKFTKVNPKACKTCEGSRHFCPAFTKTLYPVIEEAKSQISVGVSDEQLAHELDLVQDIEEYIKVKKKSLISEAEGRIEQGRIIQGWGMKRKSTRRKWKEDVNLKTIEMMTGLTLHKTDPLSPNQAEKAGLDKEFVKKNTFKPESYEVGRIKQLDIQKKFNFVTGGKSGE